MRSRMRTCTFIGAVYVLPAISECRASSADLSTGARTGVYERRFNRISTISIFSKCTVDPSAVLGGNASSP